MRQELFGNQAVNFPNALETCVRIDSVIERTVLFVHEGHLSGGDPGIPLESKFGGRMAATIANSRGEACSNRSPDA